jgi:D-arabinonate dehydratase
LRIVRASVKRVRIPLPAPVSFSVKTLHHRENLLVEIETEDGSIGTGFCLQDASAAAAKAALTDELLPLIVGRDANQIRGLWEIMFRQSVRSGRRGSLLHALSAVDIALWDRLARSRDLPLHVLLGGCRDSAPCYASGGYYHEGESLARLEEEIRGYVEQGYEAVKIKVGRLSTREEIERVRLVRDIIGPDRALMVDANQAYRTVEPCAELCRKIEPYDIAWFEEPFAVDEVESFIRLRQRTSIPLATGEVEATRWAFKELMHRGAVDVVQPDATVCGGITEWLRIEAFASAWGVPVAPHYHWDLHVQLACASPQVSYLEKFEGTDVKNFDLILQSPLQVGPGGELAVPEGPGHAVEFDADAVARYLMDETTLTDADAAVAAAGAR